MGCFFLLFAGVITWLTTAMIVFVLSWLLDFTVTAGIVTGVWLILVLLKMLF